MVNWLLLLIFTADSVANSLKAYYDKERRMHVTELRLIQMRYFKCACGGSAKWLCTYDVRLWRSALAPRLWRCRLFVK